MTNELHLAKWIKPRAQGVEIGAFTTPLPIIKPYYVDHFEEYAGAKCLMDFKGEACSLPFKDHSIDYIASSHVLEHIANPFLALREWARILRHRGIVYMVIPDKRKTWDRRRATTPAPHLLEDYTNQVGQNDGTHVADFADGIVWEEFAPGKTETERIAYRQLLADSAGAGGEINIHFHTFEPASFPEVIEIFNTSAIASSRYTVLELVENFPANNPIGFLVVLRNDLNLKGKVRSVLHQIFRGFAKDWAIVPGTPRFPR